MKQQGEGKIRFGEKASFFCANVGNIPIMVLINSYLTIFYSDVCGINLMAIGTLFLITKILDGLNDPVVGYIIDHVKASKMGRFRPCLLIGAIVCGLNYLLLWLGPLYAPMSFKLIIAYISYILIGITFDLMDIPLNSLIPVMTDNLKERNSLSFIKGIAYLLGGMIFSISAPLIIASNPDLKVSYTLLIIIATVAVIVLTILGVLGVKERIKPVSDEKYKIKDLGKILSAKPVFILFLGTLIYCTATSLTSGASTYFATYILGDIKILSGVAAFSTVGMIPVLILAPILANKIDKKYTFGGGICLTGLSGLLRLIDVTSIPLIYVAQICMGIGSGILMTVMYGIQADNVDYVEYKSGIRAEGAIASLSSFIAKAAQGIGGALPAYILAWTGFVANQVQTEQATAGIIFAAIILPMILALAGGLLFLFVYPITNNKVKEIVAELAARREAKN